MVVYATHWAIDRTDLGLVFGTIVRGAARAEAMQVCGCRIMWVGRCCD